MTDTRRSTRWFLGLAVILTMFLVIFGRADVQAAGSVKLNKTSISLFVGKTYTLKLEGTTRKAAWSSSSSAASINQEGKVTARRKGTAYITAKVGAKKYRCKVTVKQPVTSLSLSKKSMTMYEGHTMVLTALVKPLTANNRRVYWSSGNKSVATVNSKGLIRAVKSGTAYITAKAADGSGKKAVCKVTVKANVPVSSVTLNKKSMILTKGTTGALSMTLSPSNATNKNVVWSSSNRSVAMVNYLGKVTALKEGTTTITVKAMDGSGKKASCAVTVKAKSTSSTPSAPTKGKVSRKNFLALLESYSRTVQEDYKAGTPWGYAQGSVQGGGWEAAKQKKTLSCVQIASYAFGNMGILNLPVKQWFYATAGGSFVYKKGAKEAIEKYCDILVVNKSLDQLKKEGNLFPGDICSWSDIAHMSIYAGNGTWYDAGRMGSNGYGSSSNYHFTTLGPISNSGKIVHTIIRIRE